MLALYHSECDNSSQQGGCSIFLLLQDYDLDFPITSISIELYCPFVLTRANNVTPKRVYLKDAAGGLYFSSGRRNILG